VFVGFQPTNDVMTLSLDGSHPFVAVVCGVENDGESRSSRELERYDDLLDSDLGLFLERLIEIRCKVLWNVHLREVRNVDVTDLEAGSDELVAQFRLSSDGIVQPGDAIGGVAGFRSKRIVDVEEHIVTSTNLELVEDVLGVAVGEIGGRPVGSTEEVIIGSAGFRVRVGTRNSSGEATDRPLRFGEDQRAHEVFERISVAAVGEDWLKRRESLFEPRRETSNAEHSTKISGLHREPLFDVLPYCSLTSQQA
jgi:hypothetical protein